MHALLLLLLTLLGADPDSSVGQLKLSFGLPVLTTNNMLGMEVALMVGSTARPWMIGVEAISASQILGSPNLSVSAGHVVVAREFNPEDLISFSLIGGFGIAKTIEHGKKTGEGLFGPTYETARTEGPSALAAANFGISFRRYLGVSAGGGVVVCHLPTVFVVSRIDLGSW